MNFTEFSFWWVLMVVGGPLLLLRAGAQRLKVWREAHDPLILLAVSLVLFWNASPTSFVIHIVELLINYAVIMSLRYVPRSVGYLLAGFAIALDVSVLAYFKYIDFLVRDVLGPFSQTAIDESVLPRLPGLPPGISFYTFQIIAFMVDTVRSADREPVGFLDYLNFASFFPLVVAGPIERRADLLPQMRAFRFGLAPHNLETGLRWIALGVFMKFVLADNIASFIKSADASNPWLIWSSIYLFGFRIYFDFAGYSFIALGLGRSLGVTLTSNFMAPYSASSCTEFWRRWHVTLSQWFRDYVYIRLGGSRVRWVSLNLLVVFVVSGFWHGAGWNYILWGAYHGLLLIISRILGRWITVSRVVGWALTFNGAMLGWLLFMETDLRRLTEKVRSLLTLGAYSWGNLHDAIESYPGVDFMSLLVSVALATAVLLVEGRGTGASRGQAYGLLLTPAVARALLGLTVLLGARSFSEFVYFAF